MKMVNVILRRVILVLLFCASSVAWTGCAPLTGTTAHYGKMSGPLPLSFEIQPLESQRESLEWQTYSPMISCIMIQKGFVASQAGAKADVVAQFFYGVDGGAIESTTTPVYGQTGGGTTSTTGSIGGQSFSGTSTSPTTFGQVGSISRARSIHGRYLMVRLSRRALSGAKAPDPFYEIRVLSEGSSGEIAQVLPTLVVAAFDSFPAQAGKAVEWDKTRVSFEEVMSRCGTR